MNKVRWLLVLVAVPFLAGCEPVVQIRVMTDRDMTATSVVTSPIASTGESATVVPDTPEPTATPSPTEIRAMEEATRAPTPLPTNTPLPSPTARRLPTPTRPRPTATPGPQSGATRIRFQTGAISATVSGQLGPQDSRLYVLRASAGQLMEVTVVPSSSDLSLAIWGQDGTVLKQHAENRAECVLPSSQDYYVALYLENKRLCGDRLKLDADGTAC